MSKINGLTLEKPINEAEAISEGNKEKAPVGGQPTEGSAKGMHGKISNSYTPIIPQNNKNVKDLSQESENIFLCNIDTKAYKDKETAKRETGAIVNRTKAKDCVKQLTVKQLVNAVCNGYSFSTAALRGTTEEHFVSQQLAIVDIDNENKDVPVTTIEDAEKILADNYINYAFMYYSFSHSTARPKFRIVCVLEESITDPIQAKRLNQYLISIFPQADKSCFNLDRFYYGTCNGLATEVHDRTTTINIPADFNPLESAQTFDIQDDESPPPQEQDAPIGKDEKKTTSESEPPKDNKSSSRQSNGKFDIGQAYRDFDLCGYIERTTGIKPERQGKNFVFNPCPLCGHNDHFQVDTKENRYISHSDKDFGKGVKDGGKSRGNIFNYIKAVKPQFSDNQVRDYFKYDILGLDREAEKKAFKEGKQAESRQEEKNENPQREKTHSDKSEDLSKRPYIYVTEKMDKQTGNVIQKLNLDRPKFVEYFRENIPFFFTENMGYSDVHMYIYANGVYKMRHPNYIKGFIEQMLPLELRLPENSNKLYEALTHDLRYTNYAKCNPEKYINFKNGLYNLDTDTIEPHDPKILSTIQIPFAYDPKADYSKYHGGAVDKFISHHVGGDMSQVQLMLEFTGIALSNIPVYRYKKALLSVGEGNTGKTQWRKIVQYLLGEENCYNVELGKLENNRFEAANLYNKRLSGSPDMSFMNVQELLIFKQLTGGDIIGAEFKGRNGFNFVFNGLLWFCANELPKFGGDKGDHTYERFCIVRAVGKTHKKGEESINGSVEADPLLINKLYAEAPYIIYRALTALKTLVENEKYSETEKQKNELKLYKKSNSSIAEFVDECLIPRKGDKLNDKCNRAMINKVYSAWCKTNAKYYEGKTKLFEYIVAIGGLESMKDGYEYYKNYTLSLDTKREFCTIYGYDKT